MIERWRDGGQYVGRVVRLSARDNASVGHHFMRGRLLDGDVAMVIEHRGDCFWTYQLLQTGLTMPGTWRPGYMLIPHAFIPAYTMGTPFEFQPSKQEVLFLLAGVATHFESQPFVGGDPFESRQLPGAGP